jgi:pyruvate dehydrogenase E2 component (dihydrolipoamide acetyltransferase)
MATLLRVPEVAAGATEATVSEWLVPENSAFAAGDPIVTLETDKALVEVAAESDAVLLRALVPNGSTVEVGAPMALLGEAGEQDTDLDNLLAELGVAPAAPAARVAPPEPATAAAPTLPDAGRADERIFSSPLARRILREAGRTSRRFAAQVPTAGSSAATRNAPSRRPVPP